ncbi:fatty acid desaturase [Pseudenhygromyxa sp. WMMC2535]|uniref:fatty acid desaturase n=1 Tax=Pseudenhygromyxa sp. WMMC2535 TaxID=2712867 RepID=UPI001552110F|nr:fatty acid desaturase [Pseudenhygromyxa sp. WMMC2535]
MNSNIYEHKSTPRWSSDAERFRSFGQAIDQIRDQAKARVGEEDLVRVRRLDRFSRACEVVGRALIAVGPGPVAFGAGVLSLWVHKQLQATEIGHTALHGAYNQLEGAGRFHSRRFRWQIPIDEASWIRGHNGKHHGLTNVADVDPDIEFGPVRLTTDAPHRPRHYFQLPFTLFVLFPAFGALMNLHFTGATDFIHGRVPRTWSAARLAAGRTLRKYLPYYGKELLLLPALAAGMGALVYGPLLAPWIFARAAAGSLASELLRDLYSAATIFCGHVGEDTAHYAEGTRPRSKGERYAMQVEASNNFSVPRPLSVLCGGLDLQIEHHLFPTLAPERLREIAPAVRAAAREHGVDYRCASWPRTLAMALAQVARLSFVQPEELAGAKS